MNTTFKVLRAQVNKTQEQVANEVGIRVQQYFKYEKLQQVPNVIVASKIAKALETDTDTIATLYINKEEK